MSTEKFEYTREWTDAEAFPLLSFSRNWENPDDYPTIETDEMKVREDMQSLHDEVKNYLNEQLIPRVIAEDATVEAWQAQENEHAEAEAARVEAEEARVTAEQERETAETEREKVIAKVENLTVEAETIPSDSVASAEVTVNEQTGGFNVKFSIPKGADGKDGEGSGDMLASVYDPQGKATDIFKYVDEHAPSGGSGVHIGPEPPTNGETVWIDTDDTEGSFYTAKQVDELLAGNMCIKKVWENASPGSEMTEQEITVPALAELQVGDLVMLQTWNEMCHIAAYNGAGRSVYFYLNVSQNNNSTLRIVTRQIRIFDTTVYVGGSARWSGWSNPASMSTDLGLVAIYILRAKGATE